MWFPCFPRLYPSFFSGPNTWKCFILKEKCKKAKTLGLVLCSPMSCQICRDDIWADFESVICRLIFPPYTYWPLRASVKMTDTLPDVMGCMECNCRPNVGEKPHLSIILRRRSERFGQGAKISLFSLSSNNFVSCIRLYPLQMWWLGITAILPQVRQCVSTMGKWRCTNNVMPATPTHT